MNRAGNLILVLAIWWVVIIRGLDTWYLAPNRGTYCHLSNYIVLDTCDLLLTLVIILPNKHEFMNICNKNLMKSPQKVVSYSHSFLYFKDTIWADSGDGRWHYPTAPTHTRKTKQVDWIRNSIFRSKWCFWGNKWERNEKATRNQICDWPQSSRDAEFHVDVTSKDS